MKHHELIEWLVDQCERRNLSWSDASIKAGLSHSTISDIVNGRIPGLPVCIQLAKFFGTAPEHVLRMAGHLPPLNEDDSFIEELTYWGHRIPPSERRAFLERIRLEAKIAEERAPYAAMPTDTQDEAADEAA